MRVAFTDSIEREAAAFQQLELSSLLERSDVVSLHCPLLPETYHLIEAKRLRAMKPTACLVNTSRGAVVDEEALVEAIHERRSAGAALDVYEHEPRVTAALLNLDNVVLAPHLAGSTAETREAMGKLCVAALRAVLIDGSTPPNAILSCRSPIAPDRHHQA